jgi:hypothetical protein
MVDDLTNTFVMILILLLAFASALSIIHDAPFSTLQDSVVVLTQVQLQGAGCRVQGAGCRVQGSRRRSRSSTMPRSRRCRTPSSSSLRYNCRVQGAGCRVQGAGFASALSIIHNAPFSTLQDSVVVLTQVPHTLSLAHKHSLTLSLSHSLSLSFCLSHTPFLAHTLSLRVALTPTHSLTLGKGQATS